MTQGNKDMRVGKLLLMLVIAFGINVITGTSVRAADADLAKWDKLAKFSPKSKIKVDHKLLSNLLKYAVMPYNARAKKGESQRIQRPRTGTKIRHSAARTSKRKRLNMIAFKFVRGNPTYRKALDNYLGYLQDVPVAALNRDQQLAYWLNFHNAGVLRMLIDGKKASQMDPNGQRKGPYFEPRFQVAGERISLADIRDNIILRNWKDASVLYGICYGGRSGPNMLAEAFEGQNVHALLERNARDYLRSPRGIKLVGTTLNYSEFFSWYADRFGGEQGIREQVRKYGDGQAVSNLDRVNRYRSKRFSWKLAELRSSSNALAAVANSGLNTSGNIDFGVWNHVNTGSGSGVSN